MGVSPELQSQESFIGKSQFLKTEKKSARERLESSSRRLEQPVENPDLDFEQILENLPAESKELKNGLKELDDFLEENIDSVIISEIVGEKDEPARNFARIFTKLPDQPEGVKQRAKELLQEKMKRLFRENSREYARRAISRAKDFDQLIGIFNQFKENSQNQVVIAGMIRSDLLNNITRLRNRLFQLVERNYFQKRSWEDARAEIRAMVAARQIPAGLGIKEKTDSLLLEELGRLIGKNTEKQNGFFAKITKRAAGFFKQKK